MVKGVLHLHSVHSDGELTIAELRAMYLAAGCRFACITDHADAFDADRLDAYVRECAASSDESFLFIPGLEFSCRDRMHILGYGVRTGSEWGQSGVRTGSEWGQSGVRMGSEWGQTPSISDDPEEVIAFIQRHGGLAVIAHPKDTAFDVIEAFQRLPDGIEVWNSKYDGRFAPRTRTFALARRMRARQPSLRAFYGQDLHWRRQFNRLFTEVDVDEISRESILAALARGAFAGVKDDWRLPSDANLPAALADHFDRVHGRAHRVRRWASVANGWLKRTGLNGVLLPQPVKAQLRRLF